MTVLVIAEHDNQSLKGATLNTVTAASQCGGGVDVRVAGATAVPPCPPYPRTVPYLPTLRTPVSTACPISESRAPG